MDGKKKPRIELTIFVPVHIAKGLDLQGLGDTFEKIGKYKKDPTTVHRKVDVRIESST